MKTNPIPPKFAISVLLLITSLTACQSSGKVVKESDDTNVENRLEKPLKDVYKDYFLMGVAVNTKNIKGDEGELILRHYNSITPENAMKMGPIHPKEGNFYWDDADQIVDFATDNNLSVRGHALVWHEQTPDWIFVDDSGNTVSREVLLKRMEDHITAVVKRYKGKIYAWDVVNEAIDDNPNNLLRHSKWLEIIGEDFISKAFEFAHAADPKALLFYNDYNSERPEKRDRIFKLLKKLVDQGVPIHGVGLQGHWSLQEPTEENLREAISLFSSLGLTLEFTEVDLSIYPWEKERRERRPDESDEFTPALQEEQAKRYSMLFNVFREHRDIISNVTFWNVSDKYSWLDFYPVRGRKNYPLLFDQQLKPKKAYWEVINFSEQGQ